MTDINHVVLVGRLTRDVGSDARSFGYLPNGQARANVSIAVNRSKKQGDQWIDEASFFDVTIWGKQAEGLKPYLLKGKQIAIDGYLRQDRWEKDGVTRSRVTITANNVQLLGGKSDGGQSPCGGYASQNSRVTQAKPAQKQWGPDEFVNGGASGNDFPEDIPF